jgi:hypothetical protein
MKIKITENQFNNLKKILLEDIQTPSYKNLDNFFSHYINNDFYFQIIQTNKNNSEKEFNFKVSKINNVLSITDINNNTKTKNCSVRANFNKLIYDNTFNVSFDKCGLLIVDNITDIFIYEDLKSLNDGVYSDDMTLDNNIDNNLSDEYYDLLKNSKVDDVIHIESKYNYDLFVTYKNDTLIKLGIKKIDEYDDLSIDISKNPFYKNNDELFLSGYIDKENDKIDLNILVKKIYIDKKDTKKNDIDNKENSSKEKEDDIKIDAKEIMDAITNDKLVRDIFYKEPSILNYLKSFISGKNPEGSGIIKMKEILSNYSLDKLSKTKDELFANFNYNKMLSYRLISNSIIFDDNISYNKSNQEFSYKAYVNFDINDDNLVLEDEKTDVNIVIVAVNNKLRLPNTFNVIFIKNYDNNKVIRKKGIITIESLENSGYFNKNKV